MSLRHRTAEILEVSRPGDAVGRSVDVLLFTLITVNVIAVILETVPGIAIDYGEILVFIERVSVAAFTVEYLLRVWSTVETPAQQGRPAWLARLRYMVSPMALIDLVAILPFYLSMLLAIDLRFLRVMRLLRLLKLGRYSASLQIVIGVLRSQMRVVLASLSILFTMLVLSSSGIYFIEHHSQPEAFGSIPAAMWWSVATLTTVGYGDVTPITSLGKVFGAVVTLVGVGMVAIPAAVMASGFVDSLRRRRQDFGTLVESALSDGTIDVEEQQRLEQARKALDLDPEEARALVERMVRRRPAWHGHCPNCGTLLPEAAPPAPGEEHRQDAAVAPGADGIPGGAEE